ncbi:MAG: type II toxin-antitoxin system HicB family antitoxin [Candidatus Schekmanbacteria bacterium]|nr:type II toxin-antitoxin system HicB family antitoxin [Candidatus Schekmanbacteria bacterium]
MEKFKLTAVIWEEEVAFVSKCPELGVASCGATPREALSNLKEAVELYIDNAKAIGLLKEIKATLKTKEKYTSTFEVAFR